MTYTNTTIEKENDPMYLKNVSDEQQAFFDQDFLIRGFIRPECCHQPYVSKETEDAFNALLQQEEQYAKEHGSNVCCICGKPMYHPVYKEAYFGNNALPVSNGRCCDDCNEYFVIPARLAYLATNDH